MLVKIDHTGKDGTLYICDRCKKEINTKVERRYKMSVSIGKTKNHSYNTTIKSYDLCKHCCSLICRAIEKGVKNATN